MKTIQWFLLLTRCHFQPLVTFGPSWLQMAPGERQKPFHFLHTRVLFICRKCAEILSTEILFLYFHGNIMGRKRTNRGVSGFIIWIFPDNLSMEILWGKNGFINLSGNAHLIFPWTIKRAKTDIFIKSLYWINPFSPHNISMDKWSGNIQIINP